MASLRIHRALRSHGVDSHLWTADDMIDDEFASRLRNSRVARFAGKMKNRIIRGIVEAVGPQEFSSMNLFPTGLHRKLNRTDADLINLHWVNGEMISIKEFACIDKPVVWTLHDMWPFCGVQHYTHEDLYIQGLNCEQGYNWDHCSGVVNDEKNNQTSDLYLRADGGVASGADVGSRVRFIDVDRWTFKRKHKHWSNWHPHIISPSKWLADCAKNSCLFKKLPVSVVPNCLDMNVFRPKSKNECRRRFGLPNAKKLILFGGFAPLQERKGSDLLEISLKSLSDENVELVVFGGNGGDRRVAGIATHWIGALAHEEELATLYNSADVFVAPSRQDNLPNTVAEALSCGVPVVAFNIGGMPDMINHQKNGYLAEPYKSDDLANGINWVIDQKDQEGGRGLSSCSREKAQTLFREDIAAERYQRVYESAIDSYDM